MTGYQILHKFLAVTFMPRSSKNFAKVIQAALSSVGTTVTQAFHWLLVPSNWKLLMDFFSFHLAYATFICFVPPTEPKHSEAFIFKSEQSEISCFTYSYLSLRM